jgi:hypothetical protein
VDVSGHVWVNDVAMTSLLLEKPQKTLYGYS